MNVYLIIRCLVYLCKPLILNIAAVGAKERQSHQLATHLPLCNSWFFSFRRNAFLSTKMVANVEKSLQTRTMVQQFMFHCLLQNAKTSVGMAHFQYLFVCTVSGSQFISFRSTLPNNVGDEQSGEVKSSLTITLFDWAVFDAPVSNENPAFLEDWGMFSILCIWNEECAYLRLIHHLIYDQVKDGTLAKVGQVL